MQAVVSALEFDDLVATGSGTSQTDRVHRRFRPRRTKAAHLQRESRTDFLRQFPLHVVRHAEHRACAQALFNCLHHGRMAVASHQCTEAKIVIDVFIAIEIPDVTALAAHQESRGELGILIVALGVGMATAGNQAVGLGLELTRFGKVGAFACGDRGDAGTRDWEGLIRRDRAARDQAGRARSSSTVARSTSKPLLPK